MISLLSIAIPLLSLAGVVFANVEKAIFLGPAPVPVPLAHPTLQDLHIDILTPETWSRRTRLGAEFPSTSRPLGESTWLLLDNLSEGRRYEVRVCWTATQPTSFTLRAYELSTVFDAPELITSLSAYSTARQPDNEPTGRTPTHKQERERHSSVLFLEILAAADYFTTNATLMQHPPPVEVDIILDPFLFNVLPRSLLPTIGYIIVVAAAAFLLSQWIVTQFNTIVALGTDSKQQQHQHQHRQQKKKQ